MRLQHGLGIALLGAFCLAVVGACGRPSIPGSTPAPSPPRPEFQGRASVAIVPRQEDTPAVAVAQILLSPVDVAIAPGQKAIFSALTLDGAGKPVPHGGLLWRVAPQAGSIDDRGVFSAGPAPGRFEGAISVEMLSGGRVVRATGSVEIVGQGDAGAGPVENLVVYPPSIKAKPGQVVGIGAVGWDSRSRFVPGLQLQWQTRLPAAGRVDSLGFFTAALAPGDYPDAVEVTATQQTPSGPVKLSATVSVVITDGVRAGVLDQIVVIPKHVQARPGQPLTFVARGFDQTGQRLDAVDFEWAVADPNAGQLPRPGSFIAGQKTGVFPEAIVVVGKQATPQGTIRATATVTVTVVEAALEVPRTLATAQIVPGVITVRPGARFVFAGRGLGQRGETVSARAAWTVANPEAGGFEQGSLFRASGAPGIYRDAILLELTQERGGQQVKATARATVNLVGSLERVEVTPSLATVQAGQATRFIARGFDRLGLEVTGLRVRWRVEDPAAGAIDQSGMLMAGSSPGVFDNVVTAIVSETG